MSDKLPSDWKNAALGELLGDEFGLELCDILNDKDKGQDFLIKRLKKFFNRKDVAMRLKDKGSDPDYLAYCISYMFAKRNDEVREDNAPCLPPHSQN